MRIRSGIVCGSLLAAFLILNACYSRTPIRSGLSSTPLLRPDQAIREADARKARVSSLEALRRGDVPAGRPSSPLKEIYFDFDRYELREDAREVLKSNARWLKANPAVRVEIEGHSDDRGAGEYNLALGAKRAQAAKDYLVILGISTNRLSTISYGEEVPVCRNRSEECWQKNRRSRFIALPAAPVT